MDRYMMALTREVHRLQNDCEVSVETAERYAPPILLYDRIVSVESKLDKLHKQQMIFVDLLARLLEVLEKEDDKERT